MAEKTYSVTNRSASKLYYSIPELGIDNREFQPNETKPIRASELERLSYIPGGQELIRDYLLIQDNELRNNLVGKVEPEYNMSAADVKELILHGTMDEWLDCLDFAPEGVIDIIKTLSVELPLTDTQKMDSFKEKKGYDLAFAIKTKQEEKMMAEQNKEENQSGRRTAAPVEKEEETQPTRRTTGSKYKVVSK